MNAELFPELRPVQAVRFAPTCSPTYPEVINAIAALQPEQLVDLALHFTRGQWAVLNAELNAMVGCPAEPRTKLCGFPVVVR